jgi:predicted RNase H-like nuclease (RuvC/YqgF family)
MSSIGKIFVVVNLVLALLVLGAAGALLKATQVTKADFDQKVVELGDKQTELDEATSQFGVLERQLNDNLRLMQQERDDKEVQRLTLERSVDKGNADNQQLRDDVTKINTTLSALQGSFSSMQQQNENLIDTNTQLRQDAQDASEEARLAETARRGLADQLAQAQRDMSDLDMELTAAVDDSRQDKALLEVAMDSGFDPTVVVAMPRIEANVAEVDTEYGFVILDKGTRDQVQRGFTFEIHRAGDGYLGRVKVDEVYNDYATATIDIKVPGKAMARFDRASTYLN